MLSGVRNVLGDLGQEVERIELLKVTGGICGSGCLMSVAQMRSFL
jgi:hypothetical protein